MSCTAFLYAQIPGHPFTNATLSLAWHRVHPHHKGAHLGTTSCSANRIPGSQASSMQELMVSPRNHFSTKLGQLLCCCSARCSSALATLSCAGRYRCIRPLLPGLHANSKPQHSAAQHSSSRDRMARHGGLSECAQCTGTKHAQPTERNLQGPNCTQAAA